MSSHVRIGPAPPRFTRIMTGKHNTSYWVDSDRGSFVLRLSPPDDAGFIFYEQKMMRQEPPLHDLTIRARANNSGSRGHCHAFTRTRIDRDYLLLTTLPGTPLSNARGVSRAQLAKVLSKVGGYFALTHALTAPESLALNAYYHLGAHRPMEPQPTWAAAFQVMWNKPPG